MLMGPFGSTVEKMMLHVFTDINKKSERKW